MRETTSKAALHNLRGASNLGGARVPACWFRRRAETTFLWIAGKLAGEALEEFAKPGRLRHGAGRARTWNGGIRA
jgi:hypothetical protein